MPTVLVVTEGEATEPEYLGAFVEQYKNQRVTVKVEQGAGVPKTIVKRAKELKDRAECDAKRFKDDNLRFNTVWCVFDVDDHPDVAGAIHMAASNGISLAVSNPCVELWLQLHFTSPPGMLDRVTALRNLRLHVPEYRKHIKFGCYQVHYETAVRNAKSLEELAIKVGEPYRNPTTGFWRLTEYIKSIS